MSKFIVRDRKQQAVTLSAKCGPGVFTVVVPIESFTLSLTDEQSGAFAADLAAKVAAGELLIPSDAP